MSVTDDAFIRVDVPTARPEFPASRPADMTDEDRDYDLGLRVGIRI